MILKNFLIVSTVIFSFCGFASIEGMYHVEGLNKGKAVSTSYDDNERCNCGEFPFDLDESVELTGIHGNVMTLKYTTKPLGKIGSGFHSKAYHFEEELKVLEFLNEKDDSERNHLIKMLGLGQYDGYVLLALELGGKDLRNYYNKIVPMVERKARSNDELHTKIIKGAARALAQFHKYGGHGDIKHENFVVSRDQDPTADVIDVKLIDFNVSRLYVDKDVDVEKIKRYDIEKFGEMVYRMFNEHYSTASRHKFVPEVNESNYTYNTKLDRVIKACFQDESIRPDIQEIVEFLNDEIDEFAYKQNATGHQIEFHQEPTHYGQHGVGSGYSHHMNDPPHEREQQHYETQRVAHVHRDDSPPRRKKFWCFG
uniref:Protein kinase domain-containing protein n=1 Tax=Meloidogyne floridensis TaxID=298350 RepID=A0A915NSL2_9BILA